MIPDHDHGLCMYVYMYICKCIRVYGVKNVQNRSIERLMYIRAIRACVRVREEGHQA